MLKAFRDARVLVVDDNLANVQLLVALLERAGLHRISLATDARVALRLAREIDPDVILLDLHMPHIDGYAVLEELAAAGADATYLPVLVLTADTTKDAVNRALALGARDFLAKPFDATEVVLRVRNLLETRFLYTALRAHNIALTDELERRTEQEQLVLYARRERFERIDRVLRGSTPLRIVFQPIIDLADRAIVGVEALSRFAAQPLRSPDLWFDEAASVGLGPDLEIMALDAAIAEIDRIPEGVFLAVNVSPELVLSGRLDHFANEQTCPRLVFELTEHVAVDDTGAGYASMRHILLLQPEIIKLDGSITHGVDHDPARRALASSLVSFAKDIGATLIAEGVETAEELATLELLGTQWVQGFHLARPEPIPA